MPRVRGGHALNGGSHERYLRVAVFGFIIALVIAAIVIIIRQRK